MHLNIAIIDADSKFRGVTFLDLMTKGPLIMIIFYFQRLYCNNFMKYYLFKVLIVCK